MAIEEIYELGDLFHQVQMQNVYEDGKTFPDCIPLKTLDEISNIYEQQKHQENFDLKSFGAEHFKQPSATAVAYESNTSILIEKHIETLWDVLMRTPSDEKGSLINLPKTYIVPGGRFREIYYWDSYFTLLGLQVSNRIDLMEHMVENFAFLIDTLGYIPNGNRTYYKGRSQPPFFCLMIQLLADEKGKEILIKYLPFLEKEYQFWMKGIAGLTDDINSNHHVVRLPDGALLNRYWDENNTPRPESYKEDIELALDATDKESMYRHIRAAAESGWDFSCRWFKDINSFSTIHTTEIIPVDLNCLLFSLEQTLEEAYQLSGNNKEAKLFHFSALKRKAAIQQYCWNQASGFYFDYDFINGSQKVIYTLAGVFPLFFKIATVDQAEHISSIIHRKFLKSGGVVTTTEITGQQWDAPNGWAPLQWIVVKGLMHYGMISLASLIAHKWINLNKKVYKATGKLMEKYNVINSELLAGGGEYPAQDGFGWTNGVFLRLSKDFAHKKLKQ